MTEHFVWQYAVCGGLGGLTAVLVKCGYIELPQIRDRKVYLGGITGIVLGAIAGMVGDSNPMNAFMWGTGGSGILQSLVAAVKKPTCQKEE